MPRRVKDPAEARDDSQQTTLSTTIVQSDHRYQKHKEDQLSMEPLRTTINDCSVHSNYQDQAFNGTIKQEFIVQDEQVFDRIIKQECLYERVHYYERQLLETGSSESDVSPVIVITWRVSSSITSSTVKSTFQNLSSTSMTCWTKFFHISGVQ
ncbi:hypothetical protein QTP88_001297 [Uroleucon formosanum]